MQWMTFELERGEKLNKTNKLHKRSKLHAETVCVINVRVIERADGIKSNIIAFSLKETVHPKMKC